MENPTGESSGEVLRLDFDRRLMLQFRGFREHCNAAGSVPLVAWARANGVACERPMA
ncbi:MAG: hypothetical protein USCAAHI_02384 [Beijerinckiaceae bacterium]|nr:MAG: hypothetical protein USCAAHI_02384 [Beijerinckiaceae bacterium]